MRFLYLIVDICAISIPFLFSFHPKIQLYKKWPAVWISIFGMLIPFVIWDSYFTKIGVWGFNPDHLTGYQLLGLPIEEILFFVCIPYACLFTYYCFKYYLTDQFQLKNEKRITIVILLIIVSLEIVFWNRLYTGSALPLLFILLIYIQYVQKAKWLSLFYFSHMFLLIPFFIVNGILTGTGLDNPVVWYNDAENMGIRILTIPLEDFFYGMVMLLIPVLIFEKLTKDTNQHVS